LSSQPHGIVELEEKRAEFPAPAPEVHGVVRVTRFQTRDGISWIARKIVRGHVRKR
jgi:hypothetical protein